MPMILVIDANIIFAALISSEGTTRDLLFSPSINGISPEFVLEELEKYIPILIKKSGCSEIDIKLALPIIFSKIKIIPFEEYKDCLTKAEHLSPDLKDKEYFAVALKFNAPLWSNDKQLKNQERVKVLSTSEILKLVLT